MPRDDDRAREEFTSEAEELLDTLSRDLVELESQGAGVRPEVINKIFREVHSLKGLAGMLGFGEISELSHNLEDMLDKLRMGKVSIDKELVDLLYDSVDSLNRLVISINDPALGQLVDITLLTRRIHQTVTRQPQQKASDALGELALDEQTRKSLTEYEEHRLRENVRAGKHILSVEVRFDFAEFDTKLGTLTAKLNESSEVISTLPAIDESGGNGIAFRLLYGSMQNDAAVSARAPEARVTSLRRATAPAVRGAPDLAVPVEAAEEDLSLRSLSQTVRVDISKLDHVMNIVGELIVEKTQLDALTRAV